MSTSTTELKVRDCLWPTDRIPVVSPRTFFKQTLETMNRFRLGVACVVGEDGTLMGIVTDGDLRRMLLKDQRPISHLFTNDTILHARKQCTTVQPEMSLADAVAIMEQRGIWDLPVTDGDGRLLGLLHLHPAVKALMGQS